jgi:hypothetical protein
MVSRLALMPRSAAFHNQESFESFAPQDRFQLDQVTHGYGLAQRAFGIAHNKKAVASLMKCIARLKTPGSSADAVFITLSTVVHGSDGSCTEFPFSSTVVATSPMPLAYLRLMHMDRAMRTSDALMTGTIHTSNADGTFGAFRILPAEQRRRRRLPHIPPPPPPEPRSARTIAVTLSFAKLKTAPDVERGGSRRGSRSG